MTRKLEFHVEVQELNESGTYAPVEVQPRPGKIILDFLRLDLRRSKLGFEIRVLR